MAATNVVVQLTHYSLQKDVVCPTSKVSAKFTVDTRWILLFGQVRSPVLDFDYPAKR